MSECDTIKLLGGQQKISGSRDLFIIIVSKTSLPGQWKRRPDYQRYFGCKVAADHERIFVSWKIGTRALCTKEIHQREGTARPQTSNDVDDDDEEEEEDGDDAEETVDNDDKEEVDSDEEEEGDEN